MAAASAKQDLDQHNASFEIVDPRDFQTRKRERERRIPVIFEFSK